MNSFTLTAVDSKKTCQYFADNYNICKWKSILYTLPSQRKFTLSAAVLCKSKISRWNAKRQILNLHAADKTEPAVLGENLMIWDQRVSFKCTHIWSLDSLQCFITGIRQKAHWRANLGTLSRFDGLQKTYFWIHWWVALHHCWAKLIINLGNNVENHTCFPSLVQWYPIIPSWYNQFIFVFKLRNISIGFRKHRRPWVNWTRRW